jgi:hypothetical protein
MDLLRLVFCPCKEPRHLVMSHVACCTLLGIMFSMEMFERKEHSPQVAARWSKLGKTMRLLMWMLASYFLTGQCIDLDSSFWFLKVIVELKMVPLLACAVIKNASTGWHLFLVRHSKRILMTWDWGLVIHWQFPGS